jgi:hypothetical protein
VLITVGVVLLFSGTTFAKGPPGGVPMGPPAFVTMGPPPGITKGPPPGITKGPPPAALAKIPAGVSVGPRSLGLTGAASGQAIAANELGKLNAAHASPVALQHAAPNSTVGVIATYQTQMNDALALVDPTARDAAITAAREQLALASNKQLTPSAAERIDGMLGISGAPPDLGTTP